MGDSRELISFIASMTGEGNLRVEENLGEGFVKLRVSEAERRQAKHDIQHVEDVVIEMLRNARDAGASKIYVAMQKEEGVRTLLLIDNGSGVPGGYAAIASSMRVSPRNSRPSKWIDGAFTAAAWLCSPIRQNCMVAAKLWHPACNSVVRFEWSRTPRLSLSAPISRRGRRRRVGTTVWWSAPKVRTTSFAPACEFALEELHGCDVYLGSPTEIAATLYAHASSSVEASTYLFTDDPEELPVIDRLGYAARDASDFIAIAHSIGIDVSERTAHRILSGALQPLKSVSSRFLRQRGATSRKPVSVDLVRDRRGLKISSEDLDRFTRSWNGAFRILPSDITSAVLLSPRFVLRVIA